MRHRASLVAYKEVCISWSRKDDTTGEQAQSGQICRAQKHLNAQPPQVCYVQIRALPGPSRVG